MSKLQALADSMILKARRNPGRPVKKLLPRGLGLGFGLFWKKRPMCTVTGSYHSCGELMLGWRDGKAVINLDDLARYLRTPLHLVTQWLGELEWGGLVARDGDGWVLMESLRRHGEEPPAARPAGAIGAEGANPKVSRSVS